MKRNVGRISVGQMPKTRIDLKKKNTIRTDKEYILLRMAVKCPGYKTGKRHTERVKRKITADNATPFYLRIVKIHTSERSCSETGSLCLYILLTWLQYASKGCDFEPKIHLQNKK